MGSMEKHIRNVYSFADNTTPVMEINYANGKFFFCIAARFDGRKYMEAFAKALNGQGIKTTEIKTVSFQEGAESADFPEANRKNEEENRHD